MFISEYNLSLNSRSSELGLTPPEPHIRHVFLIDMDLRVYIYISAIYIYYMYISLFRACSTFALLLMSLVAFEACKSAK